MTTRTRMTRSERSAAVRGELLDAARRVFVERGYHGASLELVAGEAGYTKGAVYSAFGSKGRMFLAVYEREVDRLWARIEREAAEALAAGTAFDVRADGTRDFYARFGAERAWTLALLEFRLHAARDRELNARYAATHRGVIERLAALIGTAAGASGGAAMEVAVAMIAVSNGFALEHLAVPEEASEVRYRTAVSAIADVVLSPSRR